MASGQEILAAIGKINDATNAEAAQLDAVQARIDALAQQLSGGVSADEAATIATQLGTLSDAVSSASDRLKQMAQDPNNPVPTPAPPPTT